MLSARPAVAIGLLTVLVFLVHGYHPLADDGAVYVAGIKKLAHPELFPHDAVFVLAPTRLSILPHILAALARLPGVQLPVWLLLFHLGSIFLYLAGVWAVAGTVFASTNARWGALLLAACCFTLPVAGTSLCIMDPYVTARSFSTPASLFALAAVLRGRMGSAALWFAVVGLIHPLMAIYTGFALLLAWLVQRSWWRSVLGLAVTTVVAAAIVFVATNHPDVSSPYNLAALSRSYFFLSSWQWFEYFGLVIPLGLLAYAGAYSRANWPARVLAITAAVLGSGALLIAVCFVHRSGSLWLARLQPLRAFQWVYLVGVLLGGSLLGVKGRRAVPVVLLLVAGIMFGAQRLTYPASHHLEWPGRQPRNAWQLAFLWIRDHTAANALFALDNDYIESPGEDAQGFRATAERNAVADYFKDGGIAANFADAAPLWVMGSQATSRLNEASDAERMRRLQPLGVDWIVLPVTFATELQCPYQQDGVRVCHLSPLLHKGESAK